ncbi:hypothetical protein BU23DRAFT_154470 [Bimuria novae-zelandiae CBS 107.79]|uniref:Uncharacterized protein n=1 Tax=Bimuria novae-zelandiae CBS 107.79 TaxID=1447943 RepID=A0A6A5VUN1_9PLEO|nr:hypothetical protein BU23DRAFT_154470 [Bimuria novae-zelandiae CBS 107.79]
MRVRVNSIGHHMHVLHTAHRVIQTDLSSISMSLLSNPGGLLCLSYPDLETNLSINMRCCRIIHDSAATTSRCALIEHDNVKRECLETTEESATIMLAFGCRCGADFARHQRLAIPLSSDCNLTSDSPMHTDTKFASRANPPYLLCLDAQALFLDALVCTSPRGPRKRRGPCAVHSQTLWLMITILEGGGLAIKFLCNSPLLPMQATTNMD